MKTDFLLFNTFKIVLCVALSSGSVFGNDRVTGLSNTLLPEVASSFRSLFPTNLAIRIESVATWCDDEYRETWQAFEGYVREDASGKRLPVCLVASIGGTDPADSTIGWFRLRTFYLYDDKQQFPHAVTGRDLWVCPSDWMSWLQVHSPGSSNMGLTADQNLIKAFLAPIEEKDWRTADGFLSLFGNPSRRRSDLLPEAERAPAMDFNELARSLDSLDLSSLDADLDLFNLLCWKLGRDIWHPPATQRTRVEFKRLPVPLEFERKLRSLLSPIVDVDSCVLAPEPGGKDWKENCFRLICFASNGKQHWILTFFQKPIPFDEETRSRSDFFIKQGDRVTLQADDTAYAEMFP